MRRHARATALTGASLIAATLAACSVPREADLAASGTLTPTAATPSASPTPTQTPTPTPTSTPTLTPTPTPTRARVAAAPSAKSVPGYRLTAPPRAVGDPLAAVRGAGDLFDAVTVQSVVRGDTPVGVLFLFAVRSQALGDPSISSLVLPKVVDGVAGGGIKVSMQRFGGQQVAVGTSPTKGTVVLWYDSGVLAVVVGGGNPATVTDYARAYIARRS
jgi:hypothetical protein